MNESFSPKKLGVLIFGAGAIGTHVGGSLSLSGQQVVFLERSQVADELRQRGLCIDFGDRKELIKQPTVVKSVDEALEHGPFDIGVFALKSFDTSAALESMTPNLPAIPPILCLQNGVENEATLATVLGPGRVIAGTVTHSIGRRAAGDIVVERLRGIGISAGHPLSQRLVDVFTHAGLNARLYARPLDMKWSKLLANLSANASSAILDMSPGDVFGNPGLYRLEITQLREALAVMHAQGIKPVNLPETPVSLLALAAQFLPLWLSRRLLRRVAGSGRGGKMPSFHIDLHSGKSKIEVDYLNGAVVRHGEKFNVPTPTNRLLNSTLQAMVRGELPRDAYQHQPEKLLSAWKAVMK